MKLHVLYDRAGRIQAAVHLDAPEEPGMPTRGKIRPVPKKGETAADIEVPAEYAARGFAEVCRTLRVDPKRRTLVPAVPPKAARSRKSVKKK